MANSIAYTKNYTTMLDRVYQRAAVAGILTSGSRMVRAGRNAKELYLTGMNINGCLACEACQKGAGGCVQKDEMQGIYEDFAWADVVVFASPQYWGTVSGQLKVVIDRLYAALFGHQVVKKFVVIMTARGNMYEMTEDFFSIFTRFLGWENVGNVYGAGKEEQAKALGADIS